MANEQSIDLSLEFDSESCESSVNKKIKKYKKKQ